MNAHSSKKTLSTSPDTSPLPSTSPLTNLGAVSGKKLTTPSSRVRSVRSSPSCVDGRGKRKKDVDIALIRGPELDLGDRAKKFIRIDSSCIAIVIELKFGTSPAIAKKQPLKGHLVREMMKDVARLALLNLDPRIQRCVVGFHRETTPGDSLQVIQNWFEPKTLAKHLKSKYADLLPEMIDGTKVYYVPEQGEQRVGSLSTDRSNWKPFGETG